MNVKLFGVLIVNLVLSILLWANPAWAQIAFVQSAPGAGNATATRIAQNSPLVQSSFQFLVKQVQQIGDNHLRTQTLDAIRNQKTCVQHRAGVTSQKQQDILKVSELRLEY